MRLFVYGTLLFPQIQLALLGRNPEAVRGLLKGYALHKLAYGTHESVYPVPKPTRDSSLEGYVLFSISEDEMEILKFYEGEEYVLREISVSIAGTSTKVKSFFPPNSISIDYEGEWDKEVFQERHLQHFLDVEIPQILSDFQRKDF